MDPHYYLARRKNLVPPSTIPSLLNKEVEFSGSPTKSSLLSKEEELPLLLNKKEKLMSQLR